ncbi:MAG: hypothetical protein V7603_6327 [Micromonosporaceae bacterium]
MSAATGAVRGKRLGRKAIYGIAVLVLGVAVATVIAVWPAGAADSVPYGDSQSTGYITLYDRSGTAVKSGNVTDRPFVSKAVSSKRAPAPYDAAGRKATLNAFQPRKDASAPLWSGDKMTASVAYPDPAHPTVTASATDFSLQDFISEFPPQWDGLIQLRIYFGVPGHPTLNTTYVTTDIKVTGQIWSVVGGGPGAGPNGADIPGKAAAAPGAAVPGSSRNAGPGTGAAVNGAGVTAAGAGTGAVSADLPYVSAPASLTLAALAIVLFVLSGVLLPHRSALRRPRQRELGRPAT